ncbi:hypothetical protein EIP91_005239 [Steccherinum ochraceum]|uniref:Enoyl reductase (ER) domain-containing protein n=1 Tax=Steccherinum ochraceum TaxID=92696 RepID=A0A4R0RIG0_9APHY|nr:hypothetical protein EIP91_005239 [Steccherinum ochraceum]
MSIPAEQKALFLLQHAGPYEIRSVPNHALEAGEVLVRVEAAGLNPTDWKTRFTELSMALGGNYPARQGQDVVGTIVQLGEGVTAFAVGDKVFHQGSYSNKLAGFQQYTAVSADLVALVPKNLSADQTASIPLALMTAAAGFDQPTRSLGGGAGVIPFWQDDGRGKYAGRPIFIFGGSSSVGQYTIQLAQLGGFSPIITTGSVKYTDLLKSLGATHIIDRTLPLSQLPAEVQKITSTPITFVYDAISDVETQNTGYDILAPSGVLAIVLLDGVDKAKKTAGKEVTVVFGTPHYDDARALGVDMYKRITGWFESGVLKPTEVESVPGGLKAIPDAQERVRAGTVGARKLIVHPQETV